MVRKDLVVPQVRSWRDIDIRKALSSQATYSVFKLPMMQHLALKVLYSNQRSFPSGDPGLSGLPGPAGEKGPKGSAGE